MTESTPSGERNDAGAKTTWRFPEAMRLRRARQFEAVYEAKVRTSTGPLVVWARPNELDHCRLGLAISRRAGPAVIRNRIKRRLREAFRLMQHDLPPGYDLVVSVRRHEPGALADYQEALAKAARSLHRTWSKTRTDPPRP